MPYSDVAIIIPARLGSARLPNKPLAMIGNKTMIEHVVSRIAKISNNMFIATDSEEIAVVAQKSGILAIMTDKDCPTGTDRVYEAFKKLPNSASFNYIVNIQGDMPFIEGSVVTNIIDKIKTDDFDIITAVTKVDKQIAALPSNVKVVIGNSDNALYFSRNPIPYGAENFWYHVGIYGFTISALEKFISLKQSENEKIENLEQLRALDNGMKIGVCYSAEIPISVDTEEDLKKAREYWALS